MNIFKNIFSLLKHHPDTAQEQDTQTPDSVNTLSSETCSEVQDTPDVPADESGLLPFDSRTIHPAAIQIAGCIESEFSNPALSVRGFAEALQMNPTYLCRVFRASYNMSVNEYINRTRVHHSLAYLETTDMPIEDIAREVGFENTKYFFVLFKNYIGQTPRQYRTSSRTL